ncbi:putative nuclease HARBI1 [Epinephelus fuscoguttatus]|uniref:putative nuclease HARBI1 n=1 Tax=Epinephelus fuscoguttatus TaxID=293821 RepID=UPI0020D0B69D|nr:putative nuclease HARBI1 [Epinephelus fuscoguttatus]
MARLIHRLYNERAFRREKVIRDRSNPLDIYNDEELIERFRFGRRDLFELTEELSPDLRFVSGRNAALPLALQLLIALRFYGNGAFQNTVGDMISVHKSTACRAIRRLSLALSRRLELHVHLPTEAEAVGMKQRFRQASGIPGIVGCIDGTQVKIQAPSQHEYLFVNRKGYHSINVQIACDASYKIFNLVARWPGSTHDARILRESALYRDFEAGRVNGLLLGDSGYPLKRWLMTPIIAPRTDQERRYNTIQSATRSVVERCIGVLKRRFHCLHGELRMRPERVCTVIAACTVLHNICVTKRIPLPRQDHQPVQEEDGLQPVVPAVHGDIGGRLARTQIVNTL